MNNSYSDIVSKFKSSGKTQEVFCKENNVPIESLRYYLYKKDKRKSSKSAITDKSFTSPAFISFNKPDTEHIGSNKHCVTIITGRFTIKELSNLIAQMEVKTC
jgi:hypothetical protein